MEILLERVNDISHEKLFILDMIDNLYGSKYTNFRII